VKPRPPERRRLRETAAAGGVGFAGNGFIFSFGTMYFNGNTDVTTAKAGGDQSQDFQNLMHLALC